MWLLPLLLAAGYGLPDVGQIPPSDAARQARIERALGIIRTGEGADVDAAVRDLALCGEAALPAIIKRLNEAEAGERLLLLAAASPMARAAPLLEQARADPHPAVRAWAQGPPHDREPTLRDLAQQYLDLLAVAERRAYGEAEDDLKQLEDRLGQPPGTLETQRRRMQDEDIQKAVRKERNRAAIRFALAGAEALARGEMKLDLADAVFVAYAGLLREEGIAWYHAAVALVAKGEAASPALEQLLDRKSHDPRKIARLLCAIRADRGRGLYLAFDLRRPEAQRALLDLAPDVLEGQELQALLERAAIEEDATVRTTALDALLELPSPAGRGPARALLDPQRYDAAEFKRAAELLARCGDLEPLAQFAALPAVPSGPTGDSPRLSNLRSAAQTALRGARGQAVEAMGRSFLGSDGKGLRTLGIDLVSDRDVLLAHARAEPSPELARAAVLRLLALHPDAAEAALDLLRARGIPADTPVLQLLVAALRLDLVVGLATTEDAALGALSNLGTIAPRFEAQLLAIHDASPGERRLGALLPLGTEEVRRRFEASPELALRVLRQRVDGGLPIPFAFPLRRFLAGADGPRLRSLSDIAEGVPSLEPGFFFDLYRAWEAVEGSGTEEGVTAERARLLDALSRTDDATSAKLLYELLLAGEVKEPALVMGTLMVAAKLLDAADLARLLPLLREQVRDEQPRNGKESPPWSGFRAVLLRGGFNALGHARVEAALDDLCDFALDPKLQPAAFDWQARSAVPDWALDALRDFPIAAVEPAFRRALARAEADGRLAAADQGDLLDLVRACRGWFDPERRVQPWERGRWLYDVSVALCEAIERMPGSDDASYERTIGLGALARYAEAAKAARADAARRRAARFAPTDGADTPERMEARARLYEALAAKDPQALFAVAEAANDPFLWNLAARHLRFEVVDLALAARAGEAAVRGCGALWRPARDGLASVRNAQGRAAEALRLLDPHDRVPTERPRGSLWHEAISAEAHLQRGEDAQARRVLERAAEDRRILPHLRADPVFAPLADVFSDADERFFYEVLFALEPGE